MRVPSGVTDQYLYLVAVDSVDLKTRETGLSSFTVYRSRNGAAAAAMTAPTVNEVDASNMPGVYELLLDEDMTIGAGNDSEEMVFHITHAGMAPVTRVIELYRPKITTGETLTVSGGAVSSVTSIAAGGITAASIAADALAAAKIAADACNKIADHVLRRNSATAEASSDGDTLAFRSLIGAISKLHNKIEVIANTLTVYKSDDTSSFGTQTLTTSAGAQPIVSADTN